KRKHTVQQFENCYGYSEKAAIYKSRRQPLPRTESASTLILDFPASTTVKNEFLWPLALYLYEQEAD
uniref:Uncharacterized protein n=1 Tax=Canis lupus familiaris TaxID=9615 RepID=A0A8C0NJZ3_CANLF